MATKSLIVICQSGGEFVTEKDGSLSYRGGDAHAIGVDDQMMFDDFKMEVAEMFNCSVSTMSIKYFVPGNTKTLITVSDDEDLKQMLKFHADFITVYVYVVMGGIVAPDVSNMSDSRSSRTTLSEEVPPLDQPCVVVDDFIQPNSPLAASLDIVDDTNLIDAHIDLPPDIKQEYGMDLNYHQARRANEIAMEQLQGSYKDAYSQLPWSSFGVHKSLIVICQSGGEFVTEKDGSLSYRGGNAYAIGVDDQMMFDNFKMEVTEMFNCSVSTMSIKYFVPGNTKTLITVSDDEDLKQMLKFHADFITVYVYVVMEGIVAPDVSNMSASRSSRTTLSEEVPPLDQPCVVVDDFIQPNSPLAASLDIVDDTNLIDAHIDLPPDIKQEYGMDLNYHQARRANEIAMEQLQGSYKDAYSQLPFFCDMITETNPGSLAIFATKEDSSFHRLFISFQASWSGFVQGCRPLLFLDSIPLKSKYQGMLLTATAADGDDGVFPVAFAVVDAENNDNWHWFLLQLKSVVSTSCSLTFIAARQKGLQVSISEIFNGSYHGYCLRYLAEEFVRDLEGQFSHEVKNTMVEYLYQAASAPKLEDFRTSVESIKEISLEAYNWIMQSEPQNWANSFFQGARYNHMTSNFGERFYNWVSDAHELPITQMVDVIQGKIMELIYTRRVDSDHWLSRLTPSMEEKLEKESLKVCSLLVLPTTDSLFEVQGESTEVIDMDRCWDCSCKGWQLTGLPCCHAIAVINSNGLNPYDYCSRYFTTERYRLTYAKSVQPIPDVGRSVQKDSSQALVSPPTR